jgi:hypothetical protein
MITEQEIINLAKECKLHLGGENRIAIFLSKIKEIASQEAKRREKLFDQMMEELLSENEFVLESTTNNTRIMQGFDKAFGVAGDSISPTHEYQTLAAAMKKANKASIY